MRSALLPVAVGVVALLGAWRAAAEAPAKKKSKVRIDVTDASSLLYNFDNRDDKPHDVATRVNDDWGMWYNRLNVQVAGGAWNAGLRLDNVWFRSPWPEAIAIELEADRPQSPGMLPPSAYFAQKLQATGEEMSTRFINWVYPAKYYVGYTSRQVEATLGDFYAQLGRGLVLSVRKLDELSSDVTVRGARVTGRARLSDVRVRLTGMGGVMNPLRLDEASGRYLGVDSSVTPDVLAVTEAGMPRAVDTDFLAATPTYAPDRLAAAQVEFASRKVQLGTQGSALFRQRALTHDVVRGADTILTGSQSLELPDLGGGGSAYVEAALQRLGRSGEPHADITGHAFYGNVTLIRLPVILNLEGKHYRAFYPLQANVNLLRAREFSLVQYSAPPTTEAFWVDTLFEFFNTCTTGGRMKGDVHASRDASVFAWVGRYNTWAESVTNERCETGDDKLNRVWDVATGLEITSHRKKSRHNLTIGARSDHTDRELLDAHGNPTTLFYRELYTRYDFIRWLGGPFSLQLQGLHRRRSQTLGGPGVDWYEGQHLTGLEWAPHLTVAGGFEYDTNPQTPDTYVNGQVTWRFTSDTSVSLFVGQRRGSLRCVGGVCRVYPPFEGARLDATIRF